MPEAFNHAIAQFLNTDGSRAIGTGFAVTSRHVLTCTHVIAAVLGQDARLPIPSGTVLTVHFPLNPQLPPLTLRVHTTFPCVDQPNIHTLEDISLLEVEGITTMPHAPRQVLPDSGHHGQVFHTYGFNRQGGSWFNGQCAGVVAEGWIQLQVDNASDESLNGLSGAPVWNTQANAITGMLVAKRRGNLRSYMIPMARLIRALPLLAEEQSPSLPLLQRGLSDNPRYKLLKTKLERLQAQYDLETRVEERMRMEKLIADTQASLAQLEQG
ncbi:MAG TPA: trypsin-like peptidase domain-containing protein [Candidatus Thiothrix moscowensis]|uniref:trypsin-like peptidase domain-containing protein n=1 Tax=unclassified Thiothrix TaxID=2636184 RepID=UPI0025F44D86|nr:MULTISPECIES: trypsin-like peptidase domain-containing protein [unclassified Thiothrix]HRJ53459.1 trypsin-like peptidase domain-containing protein [Candidatus Thiothrix moscowensis]HRJ93538.1 trypsin-like peptidase domain-containing protein [Candidatus Thiothrix moscowensis]